jgi:ribosomal protein S18 acetylase RimI-like enzyme
MSDATHIRPAQPEDAAIASILLYSAYTHTPVTYPPPEAVPGDWVARLTDSFRQEANRFSYQHTQVAVRQAQVVGLVLSFAGREEARLNAAVGSWLEREAQDDEWYIDALAVFQNWSRNGIGTALLGAAERRACQHHTTSMALHVAQENPSAQAFYAHLGYTVTRQDILYQRPFARMGKALECGEPGRGGG